MVVYFTRCTLQPASKVFILFTNRNGGFFGHMPEPKWVVFETKTLAILEPVILLLQRARNIHPGTDRRIYNLCAVKMKARRFQHVHLTIYYF